ncbi:uncharacterized protein TNCV_3421131 [Trichonephila clavipes]|nr:uncharacterized protein TNCV_3421131 [Trichonephila clavipes]
MNAPVPPQGLKKGVPSSVSSRSRNNMRRDTNTHPSQEPESGKIRETRTKDSGGHSAAERRPVRSRKKTTVRSCPYYLRNLFKEPEGPSEEQRSMGIDNLPQHSIRSLSMEAVNRDPAEWST